MEGRYTIILFPDGSFGNIISRIRKDLKNIIDIPSVPPHITLREDFFSKNIYEFVKEYKKEISKFKPLNLKIKGIDIFQRGHIVFEIQKNDALQELHEKTVRISQKYVSTPRKIKFECELNNEQKRIVKKYQMPFYFKYYSPHMTIVKLKDFKDKGKIIKLIKKYKFSNNFKVSNVCVYDKLKHKIYSLIKFSC